MSEYQNWENHYSQTPSAPTPVQGQVDNTVRIEAEVAKQTVSDRAAARTSTTDSGNGGAASTTGNDGK